jgi:hypothetical protein
MSKLLKVGDTVVWKGAWGSQEPLDAEVESIEINCENKCGDSAEFVKWNKVHDRSVIVSLTNGHWAYGNQITQK